MKSHGSGLSPWNFRSLGEDVTFETGVLVFHPETISLGDDIYVGHYAIIKGYFRSSMKIGSGTWIGQQSFLHSAGGIEIGKNVGIGPGVRILTSAHDLEGQSELPIMKRPLRFARVIVGDGCDIGVSAVILPGVELGCNVQVGAGAVVTQSFEAGSVIAGVPAKRIR